MDAGDGSVITIKRVTLPPSDPALSEPAPGPWTWKRPPRRRAPRGQRPEGAGLFWPRLSDPAEVYGALVLGVRDYVRKNGFRSVILALSGGIDSALTATIAADAIGPDRVYVVLMPSRYSSDHSVTDAEDLVRRQGLHAATIPIASMVDAFSDALTPHGFPEKGLPAENLQARVRGVVLMGLSNAGGHLVLTTGNKSELATGYSTLYGDSAGGFGPIKDVPKTLVWELSRWRNEEAARAGATPPIPENSITKPPSAELAPGQMDTDSLPPYEVLDALLDDYVEKDMGTAELIAAGHDPDLVERVVRLVDTAEYKRRQYPPGPKISQKNFGRDRRLPITNRWREPRPSITNAAASRALHDRLVPRRPRGHAGCHLPAHATAGADRRGRGRRRRGRPGAAVGVGGLLLRKRHRDRDRDAGHDQPRHGGDRVAAGAAAQRGADRHGARHAEPGCSPGG